MNVNRTRKLFVSFLAASALAAYVLPLDAADKPAPSADKRAKAWAAFDTVKTVLQHPRCQNCHIPGDAPLQFDEGREHAQNIKRGADGKGAPGLPCATCHAPANPPASYGAHTPPGATDWHLPPADKKMVFVNLSKSELCATITDPKRNGGKGLDALFTHVDKDKLVLWGWDPGVGRAPVNVSHADFVAAFKTWLDGGAPCSASELGKSAQLR